MKYRLLVVTVTYKPNEEELMLCLDSLLKYNDLGDGMKVVVVDNSPTDESIIERFSSRYPYVVFIGAHENKGFGYSNNIGARAFDSEYVLFFNNDTELIEPVFSRLVFKFESSPKLGCVGIKQAKGCPSFFKRRESQLGYLNMKRKIKYDQFDNINFFISGAFMFMRREAFEKAGMFDENIFMYGEESDLSNRLLRAGYDIQYEPSLQFWHKTGKRHSFSLKSYEMQMKSYLYYMNKYGYNELVLSGLRSQISFMRAKAFCFMLFMKKETAKQLFDAVRFYMGIYKKLKDNKEYNITRDRTN